MKKLWKKFNDTSIYFRLSCVIVIVTGVLIFFSASNYVSISNEKITSIEEMVARFTGEMIGTIESYVSDMYNISKIPLTYRTDNKRYISSLQEFDATGRITAQFFQMNSQLFTEIMAYKEEIDSCFIFTNSGAVDYRVKNAIYSAENPVEKEWFQKCYQEKGKAVIVGTYELPHTADRVGLYVFGIARGILKIETGEVVGVLLINTGMDFIRDIIEGVKVSENHRIVILEGNHTIYDTKEAFVGRTAEEEICQLASVPEKRFEKVKLADGTRMLVYSSMSDQTGWKIINLIPEDEILQELRAVQRKSTLQAVIGIGLMLILLFAIVAKVGKSIRNLEAVMRMAEQGDFQNHIRVESNDEIGNLSRIFNAMIDHINSLINEVYIHKIYQTEAELQMLQEQINPHFIYNALESISMLAIMHDDDQTSKMASDLGHIMRYGISNYNVDVTLHEEINNLKKYISFLEIRFGSLYTISVEVEPELYELRMIKMLLQPILENAIYHGMKERERDGRIVISAEKIGKNTLQFAVSDNGGGMTEEEVKNLNEYLRGNNGRYKSIGLRNVNRRIKLRYGEEYGVRIESCKGKGTTVYITIYVDSHIGVGVGEKQDENITCG